MKEGFIQSGSIELYYREIGKGMPVIILHGGPDFDHSYLLPDMDRLSDSYRLIYYDQRGRGNSRGKLRDNDITVAKYMEDLENVRKYFGLDSIVVLGHSWGGYLAMQYAIDHSKQVSHMILLNTSPASYEAFLSDRGY